MTVLLCAALPCPLQKSLSSCGDRKRIYVSQSGKHKQPQLYICVYKRCSNLHYMFGVFLFVFLPEGNLLANLALCGSRNSSVDEETKDRGHSVRSEDGGTQPDLRERDFDYRAQPLVRNRMCAFKNMKPADKLTLMSEKIEASPGSSPDRRRHATRVVVMGDDRVLGRLARAYHSIRWAAGFLVFYVPQTFCLSLRCECINVSFHSCTFSFSINVLLMLSDRERESKRLVLTKKLNLQLYYIPVTDMEAPLCPPVSHSTRRRLIGLNCRRLYLTWQHLLSLTGYPMSGWRQVVSRLLVGKSGSMVQQQHQQSARCNLQAGWKGNQHDSRVNGHADRFVRLERQYHTYMRMSTNNTTDNRLDHSKYRYKYEQIEIMVSSPIHDVLPCTSLLLVLAC